MISSLCCDIQDILLHAFRTVFRAVQAVNVHQTVIEPNILMRLFVVIDGLLKGLDNVRAMLHDLPPILCDQRIIESNSIVDGAFNRVFQVYWQVRLHAGHFKAGDQRWLRAVAIGLIHLEACLRAPDEIDERLLQLLRVEPLFAIKFIQHSHLLVSLRKAGEGKRMGRLRTAEVNPNHRI